MATTTKSQVRQAFEILAAVAETVRELGEVPSGHLYAQLMTKGVDAEAWAAIRRRLVGAGLVEDTGEVLRWVGPEIN